MGKIVLATANQGKLAELRRLLPGFDIVAQSDFQIDSVEETGLSFVENAILKARHACELSDLPAIADDSGLEVDALDGQPGIYSARYAGVDGNSDANTLKLLAEMQNVNERTARFRCVIVYMKHAKDPSPIICEGSWEGEIAQAPKGNQGFGYDPVFFLTDLGKTAAELSAAEKNQRSHRGKAIHALIQQLIS